MREVTFSGYLEISVNNCINPDKKIAFQTHNLMRHTSKLREYSRPLMKQEREREREIERDRETERKREKQRQGQRFEIASIVEVDFKKVSRDD